MQCEKIKNMTSSIETIGHKLQSLEERLQAENESKVLLKENGGSSAKNIMRSTPRLPILESTPSRSRHMSLPLCTQSLPETDTDIKLKKIMGQTGILTINGLQYKTDIKDLKHLGDLGNGTSGNVVKMSHVPSGTIIAVKQMRRTGNSEENKRILMDLDVVLKSHDCKYIVQCLGCFVRDPDVWICMELMSMCFDKLLKLSKNPVPEDILGKVTVATVNALSYLKDKHGVIHRDVKPSNILIDERGNIKLCDFGISGRLVDSKANTRSAGCAAYMAPERIDPKKPKYDIRADVWSLGITLVELATARSPYEGCNTDFEVLTKVLDSEPPCLPFGEGYEFSQGFHDFVNKCLTKNHQDRPKYPELLKQPFIKKYEIAKVDVPKWFRTVIETSGIKTHRTIMPTTVAEIKLNKTAITAISTPTIRPVTNNTRTINARGTQIPIYQQQLKMPVNLNCYRHDEYLQHYDNQPRHEQKQFQYLDYHPTQLPQPITASTTTNFCENNQPQTEQRICTGRRSDECSGRCSATTSSQLSPANVLSSYREDAKIVNEMSKLYRKSPFMQRKLLNNEGSADNFTKYNEIESPKKESMLSSIGQSILRNLTTSPFSQKKQTSSQVNQIDPLWRMTTVQDIHVAYDNCVPAVATKISTDGSPSLGNRKRFQKNNAQPFKQQEQEQISLVPITRDDSNFIRVQENQSPIVLQRFYHQQNQLREKEIERQQQQQVNQQQLSRHIPDMSSIKTSSTNPFHSNYTPTTVSTSTFNCCDHKQQTQSSAAATSFTASSSHSTSSQSSTQSSSSQVGVYDKQQMRSPTLPRSQRIGIFGIGGSAQLQYQPMSITTTQQSQNYSGLSTVPTTRSPSSTISTSTEQSYSDYGCLSSGNKLSGKCTRRQLLSTATSADVYGASKENNFSLDSAAETTIINETMPDIENDTIATVAPKIISVCGHSTKSFCNTSVTSNTILPTNKQTPKMQANELRDVGPSSGSFLRRYNAVGGSYVGNRGYGITPNAHLLPGFDRRHRSPDPPPRQNRGQSPLLLRKNLLELSGQQPGATLINRRYVSGSPPLPLPRRGSESVPGSPQHFRTRIHYTPEPQRRIYRTIDQ